LHIRNGGVRLPESAIRLSVWDHAY
jgi:hypothetical protein